MVPHQTVVEEPHGRSLLGLEKQPLKNLDPNEETLLGLINRWRNEGIKGGGKISRMVVAFEAGRDGFWLARWLMARGIEVYFGAED